MGNLDLNTEAEQPKNSSNISNYLKEQGQIASATGPFCDQDGSFMPVINKVSGPLAKSDLTAQPV